MFIEEKFFRKVSRYDMNRNCCPPELFGVSSLFVDRSRFLFHVILCMSVLGVLT